MTKLLAPDCAQIYDSSSLEYAQAYGVFLNHTDQKTTARDRVQLIVGELPQRRVLIDVGAAEGTFTTWIAGRFECTIVIEPNPKFAAQFYDRLPHVPLIQAKMHHAEPFKRADLIMCAHVMFHVPREYWLMNVLRLVNWLSEQGVLVLLLQNSKTQCMKMLRHFGVKPGNLLELKEELMLTASEAVTCTIDTIPAYVHARYSEEAHQIAEFMLNCLPPSTPPAAAVFEEYVEQNFRIGAGQYRFSCHQDCLIIRRRS